MNAPTAHPAGYGTVNPFVICRGAIATVEFVADVFGGSERLEARTMDHDGLLLHAEVEVGGVSIMLAERKPDWPFTPSLIQVYVDDVPAAIERATARGARVVTEPTPFFGETFSRIQDPAGNLWWVYAHDPEAAAAAAAEWDTEAAGDWSGDGGDDVWDETPELTYIHDTLRGAMNGLTDPAA